MQSIRSRLFWKVYLTIIASLVLVVVAGVALFRLGAGEGGFGLGERRQHFVESYFSTPLDSETLPADLSRLAEALRLDIGVFDADGGLIASGGGAFPPHIDALRRWRGLEHGYFLAGTLDDGSEVVARFREPVEGRDRHNPFIPIGGVAIVIGLGAYPLVRSLTRRLERLRDGVGKWGDEARLPRVAVEGKDEIAALAIGFNLAAERIERLIEAHRSLLANASHELRSPLARLRLAVDRHVEQPSEALRAEIVRNLAEVDELVEEILLASRLDRLESLEHREPVDLVGLAAEEAAFADLPEGDISVTGACPLVQGDERLLRRMIRNLVLNAVRHGAPPIDVRMSQEAGAAIICIRDHGPGLPPGINERIFERFFRPEGASEAAGGWGLGLSLVRQIAEKHAGSVTLCEVEGPGAQFEVRLPVGAA
ncbi:MAG TPA: HAMP domain-containing sensor histidine kinase [Saliniramus sp.]|nr:HAMP domain-containing sensor histidine kinase [Saliniramus sp.]